MITAAPSAADGTVRHLPSYDSGTFQPPAAVLCRNTAPLVSFAYSLLRRDIPCRIAGKDIGAQLAGVVKKMRAQTLDDLRLRLRDWRDREVSRAFAEDRSPERFEDQYSCLIVFCDSLDEDSRSVASVLAKIDLMFSDDTAGDSRRIVLSTIHRAKGLEWDRVFLLDFSLLPSRFARRPWQQQQERNLQYVAVTRSKDSLFFITSDCWKEPE